MKKQLLTLALLASFGFAANSQDFQQKADNTGILYAGENSDAAEFDWGFYGPVCDFTSENAGGGVDEAPTGELKLQWGQGGNGYFYNILVLTTPIDLSATANQNLEVTLRNENGSGVALPLTYDLRLEDAANTMLIDPVSFNVTGTDQTFSTTLTAAAGQNLTAVKKIIFRYSSCPSGTVISPAALFFKNLKVGSFLVAGNKDASSMISVSSVYPNPTSAEANVEFNLVESSNVKVVVSDLMGKELEVLHNGNMVQGSQKLTFNVAGYSKGVYAVNYYINGSPAKAEKLVIK